ncbi:hypothetical protein L6164_028477 [Bauhinia variegata]|uniref:Uncharacterized protein n=1 Tax=Bauhinia variegata TaxID=167791 RepID=A0ACB9L691_BAUVA|nr:hypothetical protein L6164_028477 [Bauhinia variegata]
MAPSGRTKTKPRRRKPRRTHFKKQKPQSKNQEKSSNGMPSNCSTKFPTESSDMGDIDSEVIEVSAGSCTTTPKAERFRIPKMSPRITHFKKQNPHSKNQEMSSKGMSGNCSSKFPNDSSNMGDIDSEIIEVSASGCTTPKAERFRIPEISTCPPAPKKPRVLPNCSLHRTPISFFAPPDLELFFFVALRDISV